MTSAVNKKRRKPLGTATVMALGFLAIIALGTILLTLPISSAEGKLTSPLTALFTAVSATCVTGLVVVETGLYWSLFGKIVIITLIQIGGLGFMTMAVLLSIIIRRRLSPRDRVLVAASYGITDFGGINVLVKRILLGTLCIEGAGALLLSIRFIPEFGFSKGLGYGVFHSISAFCNAGFDILGNGNSMGAYAKDPLVSITLMLLVLLGGIGFPVWNEFIGHKKRQKFSAYTKFVLILSAIYVVGGALVVALLEWNNPATLGEMSFGAKVLNSFFQSVTWRTAGFTAVDNAALNEETKLFGLFWMFSGGASASTAGGVKIATIGVIMLAAYSVAVGKSEINFMRRRIPFDVMMRALSLVVIQLILTVAATIICTVACGGMDVEGIDILYEIVSAGATVGLTAGLTPLLPPSALIVIIFMMYFGRVGILTVTFSLLGKAVRGSSSISYPDANILIG
ncbi:MAG: Trk family potassium uptake protein [Clostridia bacterium]|nr:Trk family potassium uptake protein [Clostridia bacterium]